MDVPLARFLTRFSVQEDAVQDALDLDIEEPLSSIDIESPEPDAVDDEFETRIVELRQELEAAHRQQINDLTTKHELAMTEALATARAEWSEAEGRTLSIRLDEAVSELKSYLAEKVADVLTPLLADGVIKRTRGALIESLDLVLADHNRPILTLHGPGDLLDAVRAARPNLIGINYVAHDDLDAIVNGDGLFIETRLEDALTALTQQET